MCQDNCEGPPSSRALVGSAKITSGQWSSLNFPSALFCPLLLITQVLIPRPSLIIIPTLNSIWVCISEDQPATCIKTHSSVWGGLLFENYCYTHNFNISKSPNRIQNCRNRLMCVNVVTYNLNFTIFSDQN